jgi:inner membrane protein
MDMSVALLGALVPDVDHAKSFIGRALYPISYPLSKIVVHRGLTHSLIFALFIAAVTYLVIDGFGVNYIYAYAFSVGYMSHIFADMITAGGTEFLFPYRKRIGLPLIKTGSQIENLIAVTLTLIVLYVMLDDLNLFQNGVTEK